MSLLRRVPPVGLPQERPSVLRLALGLVGVAGLLVGAGLFLRDLLDVWWRLALWVVVPPLVHDVIFAPAVLAVAWAGRRVLPRAAWGAAAAGLVATGTLLVLAVTVLHRHTPRDLPSLLDRDYLPGLLGALAVVWVTTAVVGVVAVRSARRTARDDGT